VLAAIRGNYFQQEIAEAAFQFQREIDTGQRTVIGVNRHAQDAEAPIPLLAIDPALEREQVGRLAALRAQRDPVAVAGSLAAIGDAAKGTTNLMPAILAAAKQRVTLGEMCDALRTVWGMWRETPVF